MKRHAIVSLLLLAFAPLVFAQDASTVLIAANFSEEKGWAVAGTNAASVQKELFTPDAAGAPAGLPTHAVRLKLAPPAGALPHQQMLVVNAKQPAPTDKTLRLKVWLRSPESLTVNLLVKKLGPNAFIGLQGQKLTPEWKQYEVIGHAPEAFTAKDYFFQLHLGNVAGTIEIAGVQLTAE